MAGKITLVLGGARSGKSTYAMQRAMESGVTVLYVATAEAGDEEMAVRISRHKAERPAHWHTLEAAKGVGAAVQAWQGKTGLVLVDCMTLLTSNILLSLPENVTEEEAQGYLDMEVNGILEAATGMDADWIIVSNEVGLGLVPPNPLGRLYRDLLGKANQRLAKEANEVVFMVAGLPMFVKRG